MKTDYLLYRNAWRYAGPPHLEQRLEPNEYRALLEKGGLFVRNTYDFDCAEESRFWSLIKDHFGGLEELSGNTRKKVRRSLEHFEFRLIDLETIRKEGYPIMKATYKDYAINDRPMNAKTFSNLMDFCEQYDYEYWGLFDRDNGTLAGFCLNHVWSDSCEYGVVGIKPEYKRKNTSYPYYGLFYSMNQYYLQEKGLRYVTDGTRSITEHSNIQPFLEEKFHFRKAYCQLEVHYNWWMHLLVRLLYPFRNIIPIPQVKAVLYMEEMTK